MPTVLDLAEFIFPERWMVLIWGRFYSMESEAGPQTFGGETKTGLKV